MKAWQNSVFVTINMGLDRNILFRLKVFDTPYQACLVWFIRRKIRLVSDYDFLAVILLIFLKQCLLDWILLLHVFQQLA